MFRWYQEAARCYVYLSEVLIRCGSEQAIRNVWEPAFLASRLFTRSWSLQELLAPALVEFFSVEGQLLGTKSTLEELIHRIISLPVTALRGTPLLTCPVDERLRLMKGRETKKVEDQAYCLLGIFDVFMPLIYGEGENVWSRLREQIMRKNNVGRSDGVIRH